ncbi:MAG TPA: hypothetical protein VM118_08570 [Acidobacteriota bacterium]|nr:hypothetical protein [Acidobacteriota bacterium]
MTRDDGDRLRADTGVVPRLLRLTVVVLLAVAGSLGTVASAGGEALQWLPAGGRIGAFSLVSADGAERYVAPRGGTVIVIWASWAPASIDALKDILPVARQNLMHWSVLPINVDAVAPSSPRRDQISALLRAETGYRDTVWFDPGLELFDRWGVVAVPTVLITDAGGRAVVVERGWSAHVRERVFGFMGVGDHASTAPDTALLRWGGRLGDIMQQWRQGRTAPATRELSPIRRSCPDWAAPRVFAAFWCWDVGDTACARNAAEKAMAADSTDPWAHTAAAVIQLRHRHYDLAARLAERAIGLDSTFAPAWSLLAQLALQDAREGDSWEALAVLGRLNPHNPAYDVIAAMLHERQGDTDSALTRWRRGLKRRLY